MTSEEFKAMIMSADADSFCRDRLFDSSCWLFDSSELSELTGTYDDFKEAITSTVDVTKANVHLVGSSKYGVSMSPKREKVCRPFDDDSDLDVVIISAPLFERIWKELRQAYYNGWEQIKADHAEYVFRHFIFLSRPRQYPTGYLRKMCLEMDAFGRNVGYRTGLSRKLKYRVYTDWEAAYSYHAYGLRKLQQVLSA